LCLVLEVVQVEILLMFLQVEIFSWCRVYSRYKSKFSVCV